MGEQEPFSMLGIRFAPLHIPIERRIQTLGVATYVFLFLVGSFSGIGLSVYLLLYSENFKWIPLLYLCWYFYDLDAGETGGRDYLPVRDWWLGKRVSQYFPIKLIKTGDLDPRRTYLLGYHPHGALSFGAWTAFATNALNFREVYPGLSSRLIVLKEQFTLPYTREIALGSGLVSASKSGIAAALSVPYGRVNALVVGGALEALNGGKDRVELVLNRRKGFVKLALQHGTPLVPSFAFGEAFTYEQVSNPVGSRLRRFQEWFEKKFAFAPALICGRGIFQYSLGILPHRQPINVVVGEAVDVVKTEEPSKELIEATHKRYVDALVQLYEKYNPIYGDPNVRLVIG